MSRDPPMSAAHAWTVFSRPAEATPTAPAGVSGRARLPLALPPALRVDRSGEVIGGRYELVERLGSGGMSEVYRARSLVTRRAVALKLLDPIFAGEAEMVWRFRHEFLILAGLDHPGLVRAHDMAVSDTGEPYFTMALARGGSLEGLLRDRQTLAPATVIHLGRQLCSALAALHARGVIHRDVKPGNILLAGDDDDDDDDGDAGDEPRAPRAWLCDLGIAKITARYYLDTTLYMTPPADRRHTRRGLILGTPGYTPPEAGEGPVDPRHDVYGLGVALYRAVTGRMPHAAVMGGAAGDPPRRFAALGLERTLPGDLEEVILAALAPASSRYRTIEELDDALAALTCPPSGRRRPLGGKARRSLRSLRGRGRGARAAGRAAGAAPRSCPEEQIPRALGGRDG